MNKMKNCFQIIVLLLFVSCIQEPTESDNKTKIVYTISNQEKIEPIDLSHIVDKNNNPIPVKDLDFIIKPISGKELIESIEITPQSNIEIKSKKLGIAKYELIISAKEKQLTIAPKIINISIVSVFLLDFTQNNPLEPTGSISGINYPNNSIVSVAKEVIGVDKDNKVVTISPGLLVNKNVAAFPHNKQEVFPDFKQAIKYYGYKKNEGKFSFRYQPIIPMMEVGDGKNNRGVGIIVINKNQILNNSKTTYKFEGYCSIRTRTDAKETYNLGVVVGTMNHKKATFKDAIVARDYFNIGYSSSGQIFSKEFSMENDDYLTINIVGEAGKGRDKNRTTRFEYIKISPVLEN